LSLGADTGHAEPTRIFALRHGETAWNVDTRIQGQLDVPLNDKGHWQAERLAQALAEERLAAVYASDLMRAHETALAVGRVAGVPVVSERGLRERGFGRFEGHTFAEIEQRGPEEWLRGRPRDPDFGPGGGEPLRVFYARCVGTAARIAATHPGQAIALVAHGGVMDCLYRAALRIELEAPRTWQLGNASINRLLYSEAGFAMVGWSDTGHLEADMLDAHSVEDAR
jgi:probable phosphoglycerate mutase